jgi:predicted AlkP superfamily pyrophosphatase or phosphodiesterase
MTVVVFGIDALDPDLVDSERHPNLTLSGARRIETIVSESGEPSTHELWPSIITGLPPAEHGLTLADDGVAWGNPVLDAGSRVADRLVPDGIQSRIGAWLLTNTGFDAFRTPARYYDEEGIQTVFDGRAAKAIGVPNYVVDTDRADREHVLRSEMGDLFERDPEATGGHRTADREAFYDRCLEMALVRTARLRSAVRACRFELVFGYTSAMDLVGHIAYDSPAMQEAIYEAIDEFVGELRADLGPDDDLLLVSDHGLQDGVHTDEAMIAATDPKLLEGVESVLDVRAALDEALDARDHRPSGHSFATGGGEGSERVKAQLEDLGYME